MKRVVYFCRDMYLLLLLAGLPGLLREEVHRAKHCQVPLRWPESAGRGHSGDGRFWEIMRIAALSLVAACSFLVGTCIPHGAALDTLRRSALNQVTNPRDLLCYSMIWRTATR